MLEFLQKNGQSVQEDQLKYLLFYLGVDDYTDLSISQK